MWIRTAPIPIEEEAAAIKASVIYFTAIHSDLRSLREGITMILGKNNNDYCFFFFLNIYLKGVDKVG